MKRKKQKKELKKGFKLQKKESRIHRLMQVS